MYKVIKKYYINWHLHVEKHKNYTNCTLHTHTHIKYKTYKDKKRVNMWNGTNNVIKKNIKTILYMDTNKYS